MYTIMGKHRLVEFAKDRPHIHEPLITPHNGKSHLMIFQHKFDARLFLATQKYLYGKARDEFMEVPIADARAQECLWDFPLMLIAIDLNGDGKGISITPKELQEFNSDKITQLYSKPFKQIKEAQKKYNALSEAEIEKLIVKVIFKGDCAKKLIADIKHYGNFVKGQTNAFSHGVESLQGKALENMPLYCLVKDNEEVYSFKDNRPLLFVNIMDAYVTKHVQSTFEVNYHVCNFSLLPQESELRIKVMDSVGMWQAIEVVTGFVGQDDQVKGIHHYVTQHGKLFFDTQPYDLKALEVGVDAKFYLARYVSSRLPEESELMVNSFLAIQRESPSFLDERAKNFVEKAMTSNKIRPYNPNLPIVSRLVI